MPGMKYEVVSQTIEVLLSPSTAQFEVPKFQRTFSWGKEEINQLMSDIFGESSTADLPYFLGSIVLVGKNDPGASEILILDGQQRLTTISLVIAALIQKMNDKKIDDANENKTYLFSRRAKASKKPKVILQGEDEKYYDALITDPTKCTDANYKDTRIGMALNKIFELIEENAQRITDRNITKKNVYEFMLDRILDDVEIVRITAPSEKDAFRLFETLNDRGLALSAADLIKNKLLFQCGSEIDDAFDAWTNTISLTRDDDAVNFLRYYWMASKGFVRKLALYDSYKNYINTLDSTSATVFALDIEEAAKDYQQITTPNIKTCTWGPEVAEGLERLNSYRARSCRAAIIACSKYRKHDIRKIVELCESITIRYSIVGEKNPSQLEEVYSSLCEALRKPELSIKEILKSQFFSTIPQDAEFKERIMNIEIESITTAWREILIRFNAAIGTGETKVVQNPSRVHVEHILPQSPRAVVLKESEITMEEAIKLISRIGNLTLLSGRKNREASNKPFSEKKSTYSTSEILMTRELTQKSNWNKSEIEKRSLEMAELAVKIYPHPYNIEI